MIIRHNQLEHLEKEMTRREWESQSKYTQDLWTVIDEADPVVLCELDQYGKEKREVGFFDRNVVYETYINKHPEKFFKKEINEAQSAKPRIPINEKNITKDIPQNKIVLKKDNEIGKNEGIIQKNAIVAWIPNLHFRSFTFSFWWMLVCILTFLIGYIISDLTSINIVELMIPQ